MNRWAIIIAGISTVIAGLALIQSWRAGRKAAAATGEANELLKQQVGLQNRVTQIEQARENDRLAKFEQAMLQARLIKNERGNWRLVLENTGQGEAKNIIALMGGRPLLEHPAIPSNQKEVKSIGPRSQISYIVTISHDYYPPFEFTAKWNDKSGQDGNYATTLTF